jgi:hypothetical protein
MVKCGVLFEVRTKFLNIIQSNSGFKGLNTYITHKFAVQYGFVVTHMNFAVYTPTFLSN